MNPLGGKGLVLRGRNITCDQNAASGLPRRPSGDHRTHGRQAPGWNQREHMSQVSGTRSAVKQPGPTGCLCCWRGRQLASSANPPPTGPRLTRINPWRDSGRENNVVALLCLVQERLDLLPGRTACALPDLYDGHQEHPVVQHRRAMLVAPTVNGYRMVAIVVGRLTGIPSEAA